MAKRNILFVAFQFLPLSVGGSYRPYKFVKYLKKESKHINPIVLTLSPDSYTDLYENVNTNTAAFEELKDLNVTIYNCAIDPIPQKGRLGQFLEIYFNFFKGNEAKHWRANFRKVIAKIFAKESIDAVYVTAPPFSIANLVREHIQRMNIPFIVDMRDNWSLWLSNPHGSRLHYKMNQYYERKLYRSASKVIGVTNQQISDLASLLTIEEQGKFEFIPNSFELGKLNNNVYIKKKNTLNIGYVGAFYYDPKTDEIQREKWYKRKWHRKLYYWPRKEWWIYRSPYFLFQLVKMIKDKNPEIEINIRIAGYYEEWLPDMIRTFDLEKEVTLEGYIVGAQLQEFYKTNDLLLTTSVKVENGEDYCIASKGYEYITSGKKVLGIVTKGAQREFLKASGNAIVIGADNLDHDYQKIIDFAKQEEVNVTYNLEFLNEFTVKSTSEKLESIFLKELNSSKD